MDVTIHGHNVRITDRLEEYARKKLDKLDRYLPGITEVRLDLSHQNNKRGEDLNIAQLTVRHRRGAILRAEEKTSGELQLAISMAVDNMYRRIQRFKGKREGKGRERFIATLEELGMAEAIPEMEEYTDTAYTDGMIVRRKEVIVTAMNEEEAAEQMELLGHTFFVFFNDSTGGINVLYKRANGGYGLLIPRLE